MAPASPPAPVAPARPRVWDLYAAAAVGGAIGATARYLIEVALPHAADSWPMATFVINISGALVLGVLLAVAEFALPDPSANARARLFRPFMITGVLGGYTTLSTYLVEADVLVRDGRVGLAAFYVFGSLFLGVLAVFLGLLAARAVLPASREESIVAELDDQIETEEEA